MPFRSTWICCDETFGGERHLCQQFYKTSRWRRKRNDIIIRDDACDLGIDGYDIKVMILVHHINPITIDNILNDDDCLYDDENLVCTALPTHDYIHYGKKRYNDYMVERGPNDMAPWKN